MPKTTAPRIAFYKGQSAKGRGFMRLSPFYEDEKADFYFYGGYDGKTEEDMGLALIVVSGGMATPQPGDINPFSPAPLPGAPHVEGM